MKPWSIWSNKWQIESIILSPSSSDNYTYISNHSNVSPLIYTILYVQVQSVALTDLCSSSQPTYVDCITVACRQPNKGYFLMRSEGFLIPDHLFLIELTLLHSEPFLIAQIRKKIIEEANQRSLAIETISRKKQTSAC